MRRFRLMILLLCAAMLLSACGLVRLDWMDQLPTNAFQGDAPSGTGATVSCDTAIAYSEPDRDSTPVAKLKRGVNITFDKITGNGQIWVRLTAPVKDVWLCLSDLNLDASGDRHLEVKIAADTPIYQKPDSSSKPVETTTEAYLVLISHMICSTGELWCQLADGTWVLHSALTFPCDVEVPSESESVENLNIVGTWYYLHGIQDTYAEEEQWTFRADGTVRLLNVAYGEDLTQPLNASDTQGAPGVYVLDGIKLTISLTQQNAGIYEYWVIPTISGIALFPTSGSDCQLFTARPHLGPNGTISVGGNNDGPIDPAPSGDLQTPEHMVGSWVAWQAAFMDGGHGGGTGMELYLCENGYGVLETSDGEISENQFFGNHTNTRIYGKWGVSGDTFFFTTTENWYYDDSESIGKTIALPFATTEDAFLLKYAEATWTFRTHKDWNSYMDIIRKADGGPTGNNMVGTRNTEDANIDGLVGHWYLFQKLSDGRMKRHLFSFKENKTFSYFCQYLQQQNGSWVETEWCDPYIDAGSYYMLNGDFTLSWDPEEFGGLSVSVKGNTMTISTVADYYTEKMTGTFTRYDGVNKPLPNE